MVTIKILQRHDASAIIVAVVMAMIGVSLVSGLTVAPASFLAGSDSAMTFDWSQSVVYPFVLVALQLIALEIGLRIAVLARAAYLKR